MSRSEFDIIRQHFSDIGPLTNSDGIVLGIGDDAAIVEIPPSMQQCISADMLVESVHFPADAPPRLIGQKALLVNLSDLAAMAARPFCFTLSLSMPEYQQQWLTDFCQGLALVAEHYQCPLVGGDTTSGPLVISIHIVGLAEPKNLLRRKGAEAGDVILVTGTLGKGALGLAALGLPVHFDKALHVKLRSIPAKTSEILQNFYYCPEPPVQFAQQAAPYISSAIDLSDGLAGDLQHILDASAVGAVIESAALPFASAVIDSTNRAERMNAALYGGEDYELCFTAPRENLDALKNLAGKLQLRLTEIGEITEEHGLSMIDEEGILQPLQARAYRHFQQESTL